MWTRRERTAVSTYMFFFLIFMLSLNPWDWEIESTVKVKDFVYPSALQHENPDMFNLTIFTAPKPCSTDHLTMIQSNAIRSWAHLRPRPNIIVFGNETGSEWLAQQGGALHVPECNKSATSQAPLLGDLFKRAWDLHRSEIFIFVNSDIILPQMTMVALASAKHYFDNFFMVTQRFRMNVDKRIEFDAAQRWKKDLMTTCGNKTLQGRDGLRNGESCIMDWANAIDFFAFTADFFKGPIPDFVVGRPAYDNWLLSHAIRSGRPVIDGTNIVTAIHQNHDYGHLGQGSTPNYWSGEEGNYNRELAKKHGGWARGTILHTQWEFVSGCKAQEAFVRTRTTAREQMESGQYDLASIYFNRQGGLQPGLHPAQLCAVTLKRHWTLKIVFVAVLLCLALCVFLAIAHSASTYRGGGKSGKMAPTTHGLFGLHNL